MLLSNKYKILNVITQGTYSTLYKGIHVDKNSEVAIKIECEEISKKLLDHEIDMYLYLKKSNNKNNEYINLPDIKCIGTYDNYSYIVMELLDINLKKYTEKGITKQKFLIIIEQIFKLIKYFHMRGLVHRDIKPENFVFNKKEQLCIIDLGLSTFYSNNLVKKFIGNKRYSSYTCHNDEYVYRKEDDIISIVYMLLDLYTNILPWDNLFINYNIKKNSDFIEFYKLNKKYDEIVHLLIMIHNNTTIDHFYEKLFHEIIMVETKI
uniref:non-specific serine/threonine protein kinase n=1 Tax=viral metagenome TaxID=1070528 RepID=A0A6C0JL46_9ZZZZ